MTVTFHVMWMLCSAGAIAFASAAAGSRLRSGIYLASAITAAAAAYRWGAPDAPLLGALSAAGVVAYFLTRRFNLGAVAIGGVLAGVWPELLWMEGMPRMIAPLAPAVLVGMTLWLARSRPAFAPPVLQEDALLGVLAGGVGLMVLPGILDGWQTAVTLNATPSAGSAPGMPGWLIGVVALSVGLGAVHSVWSRR